MKYYLKVYFRKIDAYHRAPHDVQDRLFQRLIRAGRNTSFGKEHGFQSIRNYEDYRKQVPVHDYEQLRPMINRMMHGESDVLWPGQVRLFSKSSGTTGDKSKFIPVPYENLNECHLRGASDAVALWYHAQPNTRLLNGKGMVMGGSLSAYSDYPSTTIGDVSALMLRNMPWIARFFHRPKIEIALMSEWESKIEKIAHSVLREDITNMSGVPTWTLVLFRRLLEISGKKDILELYPDFELYVHGGVSFEPYREQFKALLPSDKVQYFQVYNASEGYFACQSELGADDMLLLLDNGIYYEFIPLEDIHATHPKVLSLSEVQTGVHYAMLITTNGGLWRYMIGDTVKFSSLSPYKIRVTGRTKHYINAFGEEVMIENTDRAIADTSRIFHAKVKEYTVAPVYFSGSGKGGHEWLIEFEVPPANPEAFAETLDQNLQAINSDYEAKRYKSIALQRLIMRVVPPGSFYRWLKNKGKIGGQHKVPRLANHREVVEEFLDFLGAEC